MRKIKKLINRAILLAIDSICEDVQKAMDPKTNKERAEAIKLLTEAFEKVNG